MRHAVILIVALAWGQERYEIDKAGEWCYVTTPYCIGHTQCYETRCFGGELHGWIYTPDHTRVREWLRPTLYLTPGSYSLGTTPHTWGDEGFHSIYVTAPHNALHVILPDGRRVTITRVEIDARAKEE